MKEAGRYKPISATIANSHLIVRKRSNRGEKKKEKINKAILSLKPRNAI